LAPVVSHREFIEIDNWQFQNLKIISGGDKFIFFPSKYRHLLMNQTAAPPRGIAKIIFSSSLGTLFEWYDFYIFGFLAKIFSDHFFPKEMGPSAAYISTLALFAAGFLVRPFGALVFGRLGDLIGRKYTFLLTLVLMGGSTFAIGLVPGYKTLGIAAPLIVLLLRLIQGLALGGEYGGAATYVAEHAPPGKRGFYTSWIQTTATLGLFMALGVILLTKNSMSTEAYSAEWGGWRYPFWASLLLVGASIYIRLKMNESPLFSKLKKEGRTSANPLKESFRKKENFKMVLLALFGAVMGQGVIWYTGQFYAQTFLETKAQLGFEESRTIILWAVALATPFFIFFGWLSDKMSRKWIMLAGMLLGVLCYRPIFSQFLKDTDAKAWMQQQPAAIGAPQTTFDSLPGSDWMVQTTITRYRLTDGTKFTTTSKDTVFTNVLSSSTAAPKSGPVTYSDKTLSQPVYLKFILLVFVMVLFVTMVYGPVAAFLVELFPTRIRYTSMSLPYHVGNGVFGGLVPVVATLITDTVKGTTALDGLYYPIAVAAICFIIGCLFLPNKNDVQVMDDENEFFSATHHSNTP
jgi:MFS family permease